MTGRRYPAKHFVIRGVTQPSGTPHHFLESGPQIQNDLFRPWGPIPLGARRQ